jgi:hypothetical protein
MVFLRLAAFIAAVALSSAPAVMASDHMIFSSGVIAYTREDPIVNPNGVCNLRISVLYQTKYNDEFFRFPLTFTVSLVPILLALARTMTRSDSRSVLPSRCKGLTTARIGLCVSGLVSEMQLSDTKCRVQ